MRLIRDGLIRLVNHIIRIELFAESRGVLIA